MYITFTLKNQIIKRTDKNIVVANSKNYLRAKFTFLTDDWGGTVTGIFNGFTAILDKNNECVVPWEALQFPGELMVSAFCGDRQTANKAYLTIMESGYIVRQTPEPPTPDVYQQLIDIAKNAEEVANSVRSDADAGKFNGEMGPQGPKGADGTVSFDELTDEQRESLVGPQGPEGPQGPKGADGTFSFDELTDEQRESLVGPQGPEGPQGAPGENGPQGVQGPQGPEGPTGPAGPQGKEGPQGQPGEDGKTPERGVDYWTPQDIAQIVEETTEAIGHFHLARTVVIPTNWSGSSPPFTQSVSVPEVVESDRPHVGPILSDDINTGLEEEAAFNCITKGVPQNGAIMFYCFEEKPDRAVTIQIEVNR